MNLPASLQYWVTGAACLAMLGVSTYTDLRSREIPNPVVLAGLIAGCAIWTLFYGLAGLGWALLGGFTGLGVFLLMALLGAMEMGDVKLMGALGTLLGWPWVLAGLIHVVMAGFFFAIFWVIVHGHARRTLSNLWTALVTWLRPGARRVPLAELPTTPLPYGVAIALGGVWTLLAIRIPEINLLSAMF
ncbi:A24 family peptidase [Myxococcota bacterium]|nr:A24 family peptidase [Myxococcota bacterium]